MEETPKPGYAQQSEPETPRVITRRSLYELVWAKPVQQVAKEFGISDVGLRKACVRNEIPVPYRGYWQKKQNGHAARPLSLPHPKYADELVHFDSIETLHDYSKPRFPWRPTSKPWGWTGQPAPVVKNVKKPRARKPPARPAPEEPAYDRLEPVEATDPELESADLELHDRKPPEPDPTPADLPAPPSVAVPGQTESAEAIRTLFELCKAGMLFEVQDWITAGGPVNPPPPPKGRKFVTPLGVAVDHGFHSLVRVLLEAGARIDEEACGRVIFDAISMRRLDLIQLLVDHGYDATSVSMSHVFTEWDPDVMAYFIERGADIETGSPLAFAFCNKVRTAFRILKAYEDRFPQLRQQANLALRHHAKEGDAKWVSLMLWAGADPYAPGGEDPWREADPNCGLSAVVYAAIHGHFDLFRIKKFCPLPDHPDTWDAFRFACAKGRTDAAERFLRKGMVMNDLPDDGCSALQYIFDWFGDTTSYNKWHVMRGVEFLLSRGAKWRPTGVGIASVRRSLMRARIEDVVALLDLITRHQGCRRRDMLELLRTDRIRDHLANEERRLKRLVLSLPEPTVIVDG